MLVFAAGYPFNEQALLVTLVALSNTYGLVLIVFLLGYGLVELPKQLWMVGLSVAKCRGLNPTLDEYKVAN